MACCPFHPDDIYICKCYCTFIHDSWPKCTVSQTVCTRTCNVSVIRTFFVAIGFKNTFSTVKFLFPQRKEHEWNWRSMMHTDRKLNYRLFSFLNSRILNISSHADWNQNHQSVYQYDNLLWWGGLLTRKSEGFQGHCPRGHTNDFIEINIKLGV